MEPAATAVAGRRRRWRKWIVLGLLLLALRLMFPLVLAPLLQARLSRMFGTRVEIGDLTFQPIDAILTLRRVVVHAAVGAASAPDPPIAAANVRIDLQWLPLLHATMRVRELRLESARIDVDRFADGHFALANLERPDPARELPIGWSFVLDRIALRDTQLRVRDLSEDGAALVAVTLRTGEISGMYQRATAFGKATNLRVDALIGDGQLRARGRYDMRADGLALDVHGWVKNVGLAAANPYVATLGWNALAGRASGRLRWQREPHRRDLLNGKIIVRRASVQVAGLSGPALEIRRGIVDITAIDLLGRRIAIGSLLLRGPTLALRADGVAPIPLIAPALLAHVRAAGTAAALVSHWSWMIERFDTADARLRVYAQDRPFDLRARVSGESLGPDAYWSPLRMEAERDPLTLRFDGTARLREGLVIEGRLTAAGIDVPALSHIAGIPWGDLVLAGRATADLTVEIDSAAADQLPYDGRGEIAVSDLFGAGPDPAALAFGASRINLTLDGFSRTQSRAGQNEDERATQINFSDVAMDAPFLLLTRSVDALSGAPVASEVATPLPSVPPSDQAAAIVLGRVHGSSGRLMVVDQVPKSAVTWDVQRVDASAHAVTLSPPAFDHLQLGGFDAHFGQLQVGVTQRANTHDFELAGTDVPLAAATPYVLLAGLPYYFSAGTGSFTASGSSDGEHWSTIAELTLQNPVVAGSVASLEESLGMSVASAVDQLRNQQGDVTVQLALGDARDTRGEQVVAGIRDSMRRSAAASALNDLSPALLIYPAGQVELNAAATNEMARIATLLRTHPDLVVELTPDTSAEDRRWLAEQALLRTLTDGGGLRTFLRAFGVRDARDRIYAALVARSRGAPGSLDRDDEAVLTQMLSNTPPVDDAKLAALRSGRLLRVVRHLADAYGVSGPRVVLNDAKPAESPARATVRMQVMPSPDLAPRDAHPPSSDASGAPLPLGNRN